MYTENKNIQETKKKIKLKIALSYRASKPNKCRTRHLNHIHYIGQII